MIIINYNTLYNIIKIDYFQLDSIDVYINILIVNMTTFTELYNKYVIDSLCVYESDWKKINKDKIIYKLELEFNEERGVEIELHLEDNDVLDGLHIFYMIVQDARCANAYDDYFDDCNEYIECNLGAKKLNHLIGQDLYDKFMTCTMDYVC